MHHHPVDLSLCTQPKTGLYAERVRLILLPKSLLHCPFGTNIEPRHLNMSTSFCGSSGGLDTRGGLEDLKHALGNCLLSDNEPDMVDVGGDTATGTQ